MGNCNGLSLKGEVSSTGDRHVKTGTIFLIIAVTIQILMYSCRSPGGENTTRQPNVLLIFTDQQNANMMSKAGNPYLTTPSMDKLATRGILFTRTYCTSPVCGPARSSIISGRMPHETGVEWNGDSMNDNILNAGDVFRSAGYRTIWAGKWHLPESYPQRAASKQKHIKGFEMLPFYDPGISNWMLGTETDPPLTKAVIDFLNEYENDKPFFLAVSYHNPHDICFYARKDGWATEGDSLLEIRYYGFEYKLPEVVRTHPGNYESLPPLPRNHPLSTNEPEFITDKRMAHTEYGLETMLAYNEFSELDWRGYYHAYCRLTEDVDREIGQVLDALEEKGLADNTIIVFTSDHGDGAASHKWAAKLSLYEESSNIPLILSWPAEIPTNAKDTIHLVSQIDILPTLCDYAGIETSVGFTGQSLRPIINDPAASWRDHLVVELADFKPEPSRKGRMLRSERYKYNVYTTGAEREQFFDLLNDPGENRNLAQDPEYRELMDQHREKLDEWMLETGDNFQY